MSKVTKTVFGGSDDSGQKAQIRANADTAALIAKNAAAAREDVLAIAPGAERNRNLGFQAALDVFGQAVPQQMQSFKAGNLGAQEALLAGLPQIQNAILGQNVSFTGLHPRTFEVDQSFAQQQLPEFSGISDALGGQAQLLPNLTESQLEQLAGLGVLRGNK